MTQQRTFPENVSQPTPERDELACIYVDTLNRGHGRIERPEQGLRAADAILAAGYRRPRTITSAAELDALRFEAVILDAYDTPHTCERHRTDGTRNEWRMSGQNHLIDSEDVLMHGPATVVHEGEARS